MNDRPHVPPAHVAIWVALGLTLWALIGLVVLALIAVAK